MFPGCPFFAHCQTMIRLGTEPSDWLRNLSLQVTTLSWHPGFKLNSTYFKTPA